MGYYQRTLVRFRFDFSFRAIEEWLLRWRAALRPLALKARRSVRPALRRGLLLPFLSGQLFLKFGGKPAL